MTQYASVQIDHDKYVLDPDLNELVGKLTFARPNLRFRPRLGSNKTVTHLSTIACRSEAPAPQGKAFLTRVEVYDSDDRVGSLFISKKWTSRGYKFVYNIESWRIVKSRGDRNVTSTTDIDTALKQAKRNFTKRNDEETYAQHEFAVHSGYSRALNQLSESVMFCRSLNPVQLQLYTFYTFHGYEVPVDTKTLIEGVMSSDKYKKAMSEYELATELRASKYTPVVTPDADTFLYKTVADGKKLMHNKSFSELPADWQDKISVLRFANDDELIRGVGYRHSANAYMILL